MADRILKLSGLPLDPYFSAGKLAWLLEHDADVAARPRGRDAADGHGGLVPVRPPRRGLLHRPRDRLADAARRAGVGRRPARDLRRAARGAARRSPTPPATWATLRHPSWPVRAAAARAVPGPAGRARRSGLRRAGPDEGHLRHGRVRARQRGHGPAGGYRRAPSDGGLAGRTERSSGRWTAVCSPPARCSSGSRATSGSRPTRRPLRPSPPRSRIPAACACCRRSPGSEHLGGGPARGRSSPGLTGGTRPAHVARATLEAIAWRVADILEVIRESTPVDVLRVDGGLTRDPLLLQLQADCGRHAGRARRRGRHRHGRRGARRRGRRAVAGDIRDRRAHPDRGALRAAPRRRLAQVRARRVAAFVERAAEL